MIHPKLKIMFCSDCKQERLIVLVNSLKDKKEFMKDRRWDGLWFCTNCSKYYDAYKDLSGNSYLQLRSSSYDGKEIFNPNKITDEEWREEVFGIKEV